LHAQAILPFSLKGGFDFLKQLALNHIAPGKTMKFSEF